jgi:hypothetical protein
MKIPSNPSHINLLLAGIFAGLIPTALSFTIDNFLKPSLFGLLIGLASIICLIIFCGYLLKSVKTIKKTSHKARILFFGISIVSFILALIDFFIFVFTQSSVAFANHDFIVGGISLRNFLMNFAIGGLFSALERYLDLAEKGDLK